MSQPAHDRLARWGLPALIMLYLALGALYAAFTPDWQAPDEPAHYNYVRHLAQHHVFPVLVLGDYPASYLEEIKAARFPFDMSIDSIRYEFHQPPLFYLLAVPLYELFGGALLPLRLLSVALGSMLLVVMYWTVLELAVEWQGAARTSLALGTAAFAALLPMHVAMTAALNNDTLAELLLAIVLLLTVRYLKRAAAAPGPSPTGDSADTRLLVLLGVTTGLGFLTKTSVYIAPLLVLTALAARHLWLDAKPPPWTGTVKAALCYLLPAIGLGLPWWLRNAALYGGLDVLGLGRHAQVVAGQLRTAEFVAQYGLGRLVYDFLVTSFQSFWGQFGWMGVVLDQRLYQVMAVLSALAMGGFLVWAALRRPRQDRAAAPQWQVACGCLLALSALLTVSAYLWYNTEFLQHQGRYLFPALLPLGLAVALGWREALRRETALWWAGLTILGLAALVLFASPSSWLILMLAGTATALAIRSFLPATCDPIVYICPYLLLVALDLVSLFLFIVPQLRG